jgi:hypothetical protein
VVLCFSSHTDRLLHKPSKKRCITFLSQSTCTGSRNKKERNAPLPFGYKRESISAGLFPGGVTDLDFLI